MLQNANNSKRNLNQRPVLESHSVAGVPNGAGRLIKLTQGKYAIVDDWNYDWLTQWKWCVEKNHGTYYAKRCGIESGKIIKVYMHREVLGLNFGDKHLTDHINRNGIDNREINLRVVTARENSMNRKIPVKGYDYCKRDKKWRSRIWQNGKRIPLGYFNTKKEASIAYQNAVKKLTP